jgi:predicted nucleic acid-binding protein
MLDLIEADEDLAITEPIAMELLAGADTDLRAEVVDRLVNGLALLSVEPQLDFHQAAMIFRAVRRTGRTPRSMIDCLIAAIAARHDVELAHNDADFDAIAACWPLRTRPLG